MKRAILGIPLRQDIELEVFTIAGVMSGTSADGVDVAFCRISAPRSGKSDYLVPTLKLLGHRHFPYSKTLRAAVLAAARGEPAPAAEFARLSWQLGEVYATAVETATRELGLRPGLVALHCQTIHHEAAPLAAGNKGGPVRSTWQIGAAAPLTEKLQIPVISDFRPADLAAGGQGAPLVPMLDFCRFRHPTRSRVLLNLGGIGNVTVLPAGGELADVLAFDTGPANMVLDAAMQSLFGRAFDKDGAMAAKGKVLPGVIPKLLELPFFAAAPPKSCGREEFGAAFLDQFLALCRENANGATESRFKADALATATAFTVATLTDAYRRFCWPHLGQRAPLARATELIVAGGGARNTTLMRGLDAAFNPLGIKVTTTEASGKLALPVEAKEAAAFALLGWLTWHGLPGNVPTATGAARHVVLGSVSLP